MSIEYFNISSACFKERFMELFQSQCMVGCVERYYFGSRNGFGPAFELFGSVGR